ncbi:MAG: EAL domain-containing protein [Rhodocyclales bacterium GT-UBC]|nr:MAG: EAL domain-containing protein [Rhodocyclales bacterium GT-UBC]
MSRVPAYDARSGKRLWGALIVLFSGALLLLGYALWVTYREAKVEAEATASNYAELLEARFEATLSRVDADLALLGGRVSKDVLTGRADSAAQLATQRDLEQFRLGFSDIAGFRIANAQGEIINVSPGRDPISIADRSYFRALKDQVEKELVFSEVLVSRLNNQSSIVAARAIRDGERNFLGVVIAPLEMRYFERMFLAIKLGSGGVVGICRRDDDRLVISSQSSSYRSDAFTTPSQYRAGRLIPPFGDGVSRYYVSRHLEAYPFYVFAGVAEEDVRAIWLNRVSTIVVISLVLLAGIALVFLQLFRIRRGESQMAADLILKRGQLETAQRIAQIGSWEFDPVSRIFSCSSEQLRIFELVSDDAQVALDDWLGMVHPEDRTMVAEHFRKALSEGIFPPQKYRLLLPGGRTKYLTDNGELHAAEEGRGAVLVGTSQDVTGQHQMESEMQLLASAFQYSGEAILITDRQNQIVTVNPAFCRLTGYAENEVVGKNPRFLSAGRTSREEYTDMWKMIVERGFWQGEIWDRRKDGGVYPKWMSVSVIRDDEGCILYHVAHFTDVSAERAAEAQLQYLAHHDMLTGLLNRLSLNERLEQALAVARREGGKVAVLFIDLDRFKVINDTLGHHVGDLLLIEVAGRLGGSVRDSDVVARLGGDEFVVMLTGIEHLAAAAMIAEKLVRNVGESYVVDSYDLYTTPSIGIAVFPTDGENAETLMKNADAAMYHAKAAGRNNFQFFDSRMNDAALERLSIEHSLRQALARDEFELYYQPVIDVATGRVYAVEALVRWHHPEKGMVPPGRFIAIAEEVGLIQPLGEWVFWKACRQLAEFNELGFRGLRMGINISAVQLRNGNLPILAKGAIEAFGLEPSTLVFEITESVAMQQPDETVRILDLLDDMGAGLAIDDFGTGYSSLSYLRLFPIKSLKLDRSFVQEIGQGPDSAVICDATIGLAHSLGIKVVAEGVETEEQLDYLRSKGCDLVQGFFYSRPVPADEVLAFIRERNG